MVVTLGAAFLQNLRSVFQKRLTEVMGTTGATFARFGFGLPFAMLYFAGLMAFGLPLPNVTSGFAVWLIVGALAQIGATFLLVRLFSHRNFAVGNAYSRTEAAQTALFAWVFFGARFEWTAWAAIGATVIGLMLVSVARTAITPAGLLASLTRRSAVMGIGAGALFGLAAVGFQAAARSVEAETIFLQAATTLTAGLALQTVVMLGWMLARDRAELARVARAWKPSLAVGLVGATATFGWFTAFTLQQAALVKVLAQVEMLFSLGSGWLVFKERVTRMELAGCAFIVAGVIVLVLTV